MVIRQGDIYWIERIGAMGSEISKRRPFVVVQNNLYNATRIGTVLVCAITSNLKHSRTTSNVQLDAGEGNLSKRSVVNVSQMMNVDKSRLINKTGTLSLRRMKQIVQGIVSLIEPNEPPSHAGAENAGQSA